MSNDEKRKLISIHAALDDALGDTDPMLDDDITDAELREEEPVLWAAMQIAKLIGLGPWDRSALQEDSDE